MTYWKEHVTILESGGDKMNIGEKMKELMKTQNITQKELANRLNVQEATISRYINNSREPNAENLANIATALYTTVDYLVGKNNSSEINCNYGQLKFLVARNATYLSQQETLDIINILLNGSKEF